jgi:hypothetical protein
MCTRLGGGQPVSPFSIATPFFLSLSFYHPAGKMGGSSSIATSRKGKKKCVCTHREKKDSIGTHTREFQPYAHAYLVGIYSGERSPMRLCIYSDTSSTGPAYISLPNSFVFGRGFFLFFLFFYIFPLFIYLFLPFSLLEAGGM